MVLKQTHFFYVQEIVGRQQYKLLSANLQQGKGSAATSTGAGKAGSSATAGRTAAASGATATSAKGVAAAGSKATSDAATKKQAAATAAAGSKVAPPLAAAKTKPVTSASFAAIAAAGSDAAGFSGAAAAAAVIGLPSSAAAAATGKPAPLTALVGPGKLGAVPSATAAVTAAAGAPKKREDGATGPPAGLAGTAITPLPATSLVDSSNDFSPFKSFSSMSGAQGFGWGGPAAAVATTMAGPKGFATAASQPDLSKAPGYNRGLLPASNSPVLGPTSNSAGGLGVGAWSSSSGVIISSPLTTIASTSSAFRKPSGDSSLTAGSSSTAGATSSGGGLYPAQERCNSAPGTPVSPLIPSPIAPPPTQLAGGGSSSKPSNNSNTTSPVIGEPGSSGTGSSSSNNNDWRSSHHHLHQPLPNHQHRSGSSSLLRSLTPDADFVGGGGSSGSWLHADESESAGVVGRASRQGTGSYGHNSPAKSAANVSSASPIMPPDLFSGGSNKPLDSVAAANLQNMAAQLSSLPGNQFDMLTHHHTHHLPPLADLSVAAASTASSYGSFNRFGGGPSRFSAPPISSTGNITSTAASTVFGMQQQPLMSGLPHKGLNPYATEFSHGSRSLGNRMNSGPPPPMQQQQQLPHHLQQNHKAVSGNSAYPGSYGGHHFGSSGGMNNFQTSILTNQGINAYLSQMSGGQQPQPPVPLDIGGLGVGLADLSLSGRTLSELTDILGGGGGSGVPDSQFTAGNLLVGDQPVLMEPKGLFSRPIGAERRTAGPSPIGGGGGSLSATSVGRTNKMVDPYAVWEFPPSYMENLNAAAAAAAAASDVTGFSGLISSLSGQTLASMESLVGSSGGGNQFNGGVGGGLHHGGHHHHHSLAGHGGGFGMASSAVGGGSLTPNKQQPDYSDWGTGSTSSSAPGSANKNNHVTGFYERGDAASVRRNIVSFLFNFTKVFLSLHPMTLY
jgi:hypothetical protein